MTGNRGKVRQPGAGKPGAAKRLPVPWWAAAILAVAWLIFSFAADAQTKAPDFKTKQACDIRAWVGTNTKRTVFKLHTRRLWSSPAVAEIPMADGLVVRVSGIRGWWMLATAVRDRQGRPLWKGRAWVWSRLLVQMTEKDTQLRKKPAKDAGGIIDVPKDARMQLRGCRDGWALLTWRSKRGWLAPKDQCPPTDINSRRSCRYSAR